MSKPRGERAPRPAGSSELFREAMKDVRPLRAAQRVEPWRAPPAPVPAQRIADERAVLGELARLAATGDDDVEAEDDTLFLRAGLPREILRKLRRTHWVIQADLDLHGLAAEAALLQTAAFLADAKRRGLRCVRIIHGKGLRSPGRTPVLKGKVRRMLARRDEVLAYAEPRGHHGGGGAVVVLLEA